MCIIMSMNMTVILMPTPIHTPTAMRGGRIITTITPMKRMAIIITIIITKTGK